MNKSNIFYFSICLIAAYLILSEAGEMRIIELLTSLSISDFSVPEQEQIQEKVEQVLECKENPNVHERCKNILEQYLEAKENTGEPYVHIQ